MKNLREKFLKWKEVFESNGLKINLKKTKEIVSDLKEEILKGKVYPCDKCSQRVKANSIVCTKCDKWVHCRCAKIKSGFDSSKSFNCKRCVEAIKSIVGPAEELTFYDHVFVT